MPDLDNKNNDVLDEILISNESINNSSFHNLDEIYQTDTAPDKPKKKKRNPAFKIAAVFAVIAVLSSTVAVLSVSNNLNRNNKAVNAQDAAAQVLIPEKPESLVSAASDVSEEEIPETPKLVYESDKLFNVNSKRFSDKIINQLDKELTAQYVALYDVTADEFIYEKNGSLKCYPASTTKLLTAIVSSKIITDIKTVIKVGDEIEMIGEESSTAGLKQNMRLTYEMLLDALLLPSGNDAAYTIAVNSAKIYKNDKTLSNEEAVKIFMELMNDAAKQLGADHTHYVTPDGWHDDNHYTTAEDLAIIGAYAKTIPVISNSCAKPYAEWTTIHGDTLVWYNSNRILLEDSGQYSKYCDGLKTGFTDEAGSSVVASATINGHTMIAVVMNGFTMYTKYDDANKLFKYAFDLYKLKYTFG